MRKFVVEVDDVITKEDLEFYLSKDICDKTKTTELPQVPMVETGVLKSYDEITGVKTDRKFYYELGKSTDRDGVGWYIDNGEKNKLVGKRIVIAEHVFPREFYKNIQREFDFSKMPENAVVVVKYGDDNFVIGKVNGLEDRYLRICSASSSAITIPVPIYTDLITSIQVVGVL